MAKPDNIEIEILEDGTIKTTTDPVSQANHMNAEKFLANIEKMAGGKRTVTSRGHGHTALKQSTGQQQKG